MKKKMKRICYLGIGYVSLGLGLLGVILPGLPTVVFLIVAVWAFSRSSEKLRDKILHHKIYGPMIQRWHKHRVIPLTAKIGAGIAMTGSFILCYAFTDNILWPAISGFVMACAYAFILSCPSTVREAKKS
jgi:uncharacterized protein